MSLLKQLAALNHFIWLDDLSRGLIQTGKLDTYLKEYGISGLTSNPAIFQKAIADDPRYCAQLEALRADTSLSSEARFEHLAIEDVRSACDVFAELFEKSNKKQGFVSFELAPRLAFDTENSIHTARVLWQKIDRPNAMIKLPATKEGIEAMRVLVEEDAMPINMTLLFSPAQLEACFDQYLLALSNRLAQGKSLAGCFSVASVFLSRWDTRLDEKLPEGLQGKTALAIARSMYRHLYLPRFEGTQFQRFMEAGALPQQLVWASTGTKNPRYSPTLYADGLMLKNTINTLPDATLKLFLEQGNIEYFEKNQRLSEQDAEQLAAIEALGIDLELEGETLQSQGLTLFETAFESLLTSVS